MRCANTTSMSERTTLGYDPAAEKRDRAFFKAHRKRRLRLRLATEGEEIIMHRAAKADGGEPMPEGCICFALVFRRQRKELGAIFYYVPSKGEETFDMPDDDTELEDIGRYGITVMRDAGRLRVSSLVAALGGSS
jgi:hypothetical protein